MTLHQLSPNLSYEQKSAIGMRIAAKFFAMEKVKPVKIPAKENGYNLMVNDYPEEWLKKHGQKVIDNFLAVRVNG